MDWTEILGTLTGLWCVWLLWRQSIWNWPVGLLNNAFFFVLFWQAGLFADATLQIVFALLGLWGWWAWRRGALNTDCPPGRLNARKAAALAMLLPALTAVIALFLRRFSESTVPVWDAWVTALSLGAVWMQGRKYLENWLLWIVVDVFSIGLYVYKGLHLTAALYLLFIGLCVAGYRDWRRQIP